MRIVAIIQARMGSTRLPGKVLMPLAGKSVLSHVVARARASGCFDEVVVATTTRAIDDPIVIECGALGATVVRGDEQDVLARYGLAAEKSDADAIMRITSDCPLIDPEILAAIVKLYNNHGRADLVSNARLRTFPRGLDAELFSRAALVSMLAEAKETHQREHVTPYIYEHPERYIVLDYVSAHDHSALRWTLDTPEDFELLDRIFGATDSPDALRLVDVLTILDDHPEWAELNAHIEQKKVK